jgi:Carboxypeptidase regulatory-like domain
MTRLLLLMLVCVPAWPQGTNATLEGQVTDPSGGAIAGAVVKATSANTGYTRVQTTTNAGAYHLSLPVGPYELRVGVPNFGEYVR